MLDVRGKPWETRLERAGRPAGNEVAMLPRYAADYRTLFWAMVLTPTTVAVAFLNPGLAPWLTPVCALLRARLRRDRAQPQPLPDFREKVREPGVRQLDLGLLRLPDVRLDPDPQPEPPQVRQPRRRRDHHLAPHEHAQRIRGVHVSVVSSYWQSDPIKAFIRKARDAKSAALSHHHHAIRDDRSARSSCCSALAIALHGVKTGLVVWVCACLIPALFALWTIMLFNYEQHVHTDPWSKHNHSRSFTSRLTNFFLFNNGLHAAHHENPGTHWSKLWDAHTPDRARDRSAAEAAQHVGLLLLRVRAGAVLTALRHDPGRPRSVRSAGRATRGRRRRLTSTSARPAATPRC